MDKIWANRLLAGTKVWADVPEKRRASVQAELQARADAGVITAEQLAETISK